MSDGFKMFFSVILAVSFAQSGGILCTETVNEGEDVTTIATPLSVAIAQKPQ